MSLFVLFSFFLITAGSYIHSDASITEGDHITKPGCPSKCGNLTVPYPFGIGKNADCSLNPFFDINCLTSSNPPRAFIGTDGLEVVGIYDTKIRVKSQAALKCFDTYKKAPDLDVPLSFNFSGSSFSFSDENKLVVVGCNAASILALKISDTNSGNFISYGIAICNKIEDLNNGSCSGIGCSQTSIFKGLQSIILGVILLTNQSSVWSFNPCTYTFLAEKDSYTFRVSDISANSSMVNRIVARTPLVIDWAIGHSNCNEAKNNGGVICKGESVCVDSDTGLGGYRCICSQGYTGNPYISPGCQDIDECESNPCHKKANCINSLGSYNCSCKSGYFGDGTKDGIGCYLRHLPTKTMFYADLLLGLASFSALLFSFWIYRIMKTRKKNKLKQKHFKRNGGLLLKQQMTADDYVLERMRIFTYKELERATDKFNENLVLGHGGQGTVYKGMLSDGRIVAVKKSEKVDTNRLGEFINELFILSQINHKNVVKLHGCCLETEIPLLVYEFIPNGNLYDLIHDNITPFSWDMRLRIAAEVANGLAYLHYATSLPIYHRDVKSKNILLHDEHRAKISDFGISRSIAIDQSHLTTKVKGTFGYVDPEYFQRGKFTEKSDVYSFGVVLVELLTGLKPISTNETEEVLSLVLRFLSTMENGEVKTVLDSRIVGEVVWEDQFVAVADLAKRCLDLKGRRRPNMREVAMELERIRKCENPSFVESNTKDVVSCSESELESLELSD